MNTEPSPATGEEQEDMSGEQKWSYDDVGGMKEPTSGGEWTASFVSQLYCTLSPWQNIADAHNAALADAVQAEWERTAAIRKELQDQLTSERKNAVNQLTIARQLRTQLAATEAAIDKTPRSKRWANEHRTQTRKVSKCIKHVLKIPRN
jgi:hypothetical protein